MRQREHLALERDVRGHHDLLDRAESVNAIGAGIPRRVDDVARGVIDSGIAFQDLLIGDGMDQRAIVLKRLRRAAPVVDDALDRRAVERMQRDQFAAARALAPKRRRVDDEQVFEQHAQPDREAMLAIGPLEKPRELVYALSPRPACAAARAQRPRHALDLILARLDDEPQQIIGLGERAKILEADRLIGAGARDDVVARRKIHLPPGDVGGRDWAERRKRPEPAGRTGRAGRRHELRLSISDGQRLRRQRP